ncbi:MAG: cupin domain-containing protein, partial [Sandaracinaceae bacterium]|nr:cupin domain-containing protein [Sandaracinaceae bacterium]
DPVPGVAIERMELPPGARMAGTPHTPGTREYLTCERGRIALIASGDRFTLEPGDVVAFRGDQRHSYHNEDSALAVGYSVVLLVSPLVGE